MRKNSTLPSWSRKNEKFSGSRGHLLAERSRYDDLLLAGIVDGIGHHRKETGANGLLDRTRKHQIHRRAPVKFVGEHLENQTLARVIGCLSRGPFGNRSRPLRLPSSITSAKMSISLVNWRERARLRERLKMPNSVGFRSVNQTSTMKVLPAFLWMLTVWRAFLARRLDIFGCFNFTRNTVFFSTL